MKCRKWIQTQTRPAGLREAGSTPWLSSVLGITSGGGTTRERLCLHAAQQALWGVRDQAGDRGAPRPSSIDHW